MSINTNKSYFFDLDNKNGRGKRNIALIISAVFSVLLFLVAIFYLLYMRGTFISRSVCFVKKEMLSENVSISLNNKVISVKNNKKEIYNSKDKFLVQDFLFEDIDNDDIPELLILCWKIGKYGMSRPFFVEKDDKKWIQHLYIYEVEEERIDPKWMTSDLMQTVTRWKFDDRGILFVENTEGESSMWIWQGFGLKNLDNSIDIVVAGDNLIHSNIYKFGIKNGNQYDFLYSNIAETIKAADIAVINQETVFVDDPKEYSDFPRFGTPLEVGKAVKAAGFDVLLLANNHILDKGLKGISTTTKFCDDNNLTYLGVKQVKENCSKDYNVIAKNGMKVAMFNYTYGINGEDDIGKCSNYVNVLDDEEKISREIINAKEENDIVLVFVHWGQEYDRNVDDYQNKWVSVFNEAGADVVVGSHPHVVQKYEILTSSNNNKTLVYYSLGNFVSGQDKPDRIVGAISKFTITNTFDGVKVSSYGMEYTVTHQENNGEYTVYLLDDYPDAKLKKHRLKIKRDELNEILTPAKTSLFSYPLSAMHA